MACTSTGSPRCDEHDAYLRAQQVLRTIEIKLEIDPTFTISRTAVSMATLGALGSMLGSEHDGSCGSINETREQAGAQRRSTEVGSMLGSKHDGGCRDVTSDTGE